MCLLPIRRPYRTLGIFFVQLGRLVGGKMNFIVNLEVNKLYLYLLNQFSHFTLIHCEKDYPVGSYRCFVFI
ncbi:MAG: hypothetical protein JWQ84_1588 [Mucilaginibacter sp.]|nr:hypothetical protein [Mucilaginibacter sp.]